MIADAGSWFTTYHRHRRHPAGHRGHDHRMSAHTGSVPNRKHGRSRSHVYHFYRGTGTDRADHRRSHTWMDHRMRCPRIVVVPVPVKREGKVVVSHSIFDKSLLVHSLLGIADIEGTHRADLLI